ncbi:uncharacterized protein LOC111263730 isoform X1 [Varroa jacobsoni]|uniref:Uncharacterized protein n=1 Tax=Varroa destructor TaxID=109461 RepID=A0A7M7KKH2_VARDE|nr:uncharacterized protein LOC111252599 isoform X2 [Varroa destructor]XP_022694829.1 uncharacterized protein LOC111263730 isoform X1 [Varroa jacobsoni]
MAPVATEAPNVETYGELLKKLKEAASDQVDLNKKIEPVPDFVKAQHVNYIMGYVFLVFVLQTGSVCGTLLIIEGSTNAEDQFTLSAQYLLPSTIYFVMTSVLTVSTTFYHDHFPLNVVILVVNLTGLAVIFVFQVLSFGLEQSKLSDIPALRFAFFCCMCISGASFVIPWISLSPVLVRSVRPLIAFSTMIITLLWCRLYQEFRYLPLLILFFGLIYVLLRSEVLAGEKLVDRRGKIYGNDESGLYSALVDAIHVTLQILAGPLAVCTGLLAMSITILRPQRPWP